MACKKKVNVSQGGSIGRLQSMACKKRTKVNGGLAKKGKNGSVDCNQSVEMKLRRSKWPIHKKRKVLKNNSNDEVASALGTPLHSVLGTWY